MAVIDSKVSWVPNGPAPRKPLTVAQINKIRAERAKLVPGFMAMHSALATAIKSVKSTWLRYEVGVGLVIGTNAKELEVIVYTPESTFEVGGIFEWHVYYGDGSKGLYTVESYPGDMSAEDIAYRADFLVNIVNAYTKALRAKYTRKMKAITDRLVFRQEAPAA